MADRPSARTIIESVSTGFAALPVDLPGVEGPDGPLGWAGYGDAVREAVEHTGEPESVVCGTARIPRADDPARTVEAVLVAFEFGFLGGSVGGRTGLVIEAAFDHAVRAGLPVVSFIATGGSRMQEGMRALTQLQRIAAALGAARAAGVPHLAVLHDPTTGGGWATLGAGADVTLAVRHAQVGFAGSRVRPPGDGYAYSAQSQRETGHVDQLVDPDDLPGALSRWLTVLTANRPGHAPVPQALGEARGLPETGWDAVLRARAPERPRAGHYLDSYFDLRCDISGDRCGGVDPGVLCGFGLRDGEVIAYAAQCGTPTLPAGFRTAARLVALADRLGIPVLTLVDTPGAANDAEAERAGAGPAIAALFTTVAATTVPVTTLVIGEGGSGGALAFAAPGRTWVTADSYFSVTAPEAAAAILKRADDEVPATADELRLRPQDLVDLGVAVSVVVPNAG